MTILFQLMIRLMLAGLASDATALPAPEVVWPADGLTRDALIMGISDATGKPGAIHATSTREADGSPTRSGFVDTTRLLCTKGSVPPGDAFGLLAVVYGMTAWDVDGTTVWIEKNHAPALLLADARQRGGGPNREAQRGAEILLGDVDLEDVSAEQAIRRIALAFDVVIVYSGKCDPSGGQVSLALEDVDLDTCLSLLVEQLGLKWLRVDSVIYLEPQVATASEMDSVDAARESAGARTSVAGGLPVGPLQGKAKTPPQESAASARQLDLAEAMRLCEESEVRDPVAGD